MVPTLPIFVDQAGVLALPDQTELAQSLSTLPKGYILLENDCLNVFPFLSNLIYLLIKHLSQHFADFVVLQRTSPMVIGPLSPKEQKNHNVQTYFSFKNIIKY